MTELKKAQYTWKVYELYTPSQQYNHHRYKLITADRLLGRTTDLNYSGNEDQHHFMAPDCFPLKKNKL
jgi:hypothetical protein